MPKVTRKVIAMRKLGKVPAPAPVRVERPRNLAIPPAGIPQNPEIHLRAHLAIRRKILPGSLDSSSSDGQGEAASSNGGDSDGSSDSDGGSDSDSGGDSDGSSDSDSGSAPGEARPARLSAVIWGYSVF